ncbi:hypothetical protein KAS79_00825 [Candidatus Parcubacteria bacterium]|nr:hypothetical protein [Candidatus Parcubacteria bacterium]
MIFSFSPNLTFNIIRIFFLTALSSGLAVLLTPILTHFLYKYKLWRKEARKKTITGDEAVVFYKLHKEREVSTPRGGGILIWATTLIIILLCALSQEFNFLSRGQTWLPFFALMVGSIVGLFDDILQVFGKGKYVAGGLSFKQRMAVIILIGLIGGAWCYFKLGWDTIHIPLIGDLFIDFWYIPLFIIVMLASWSGGIIDGIDGLAGGIFAIMFGAYGIIAFWQGLFDLAAFCAVISGAILAFLWFNIPPARFYMGETGTIGLTSALAVVAFLTDSVAVLPIIAGLLVIESGSVILQLLSKKFRKKKIWLCTPIHHHFEAKGWPPHKVTMRFWLIGIILAILGVTIRLLG